ncbi:Hypothetical protein NTJ_01295 [Nesidiocoris tenuis]|uniref:BZIP domain-containing protein n=1 Tax=Nesidiocoris tenuis TaxID=355587 RepID=A0ABN7AB32_9HEMI|nr:Hypothetical protein NTJ_01295 [Nesidiocoris tenuis]
MNDPRANERQRKRARRRIKAQERNPGFRAGKSWRKGAAKPVMSRFCAEGLRLSYGESMAENRLCFSLEARSVVVLSMPLSNQTKAFPPVIQERPTSGVDLAGKSRRESAVLVNVEAASLPRERDGSEGAARQSL